MFICILYSHKNMYPYTIFEAYKIVDNTMMSHPKHIPHSFGSNMGINFFCVFY